jgi:hypothetical protein
LAAQEVELPPDTEVTIGDIRSVSEFWSTFDNLLEVDTTPTTITLPSVIVSGLPTTAVVVRVVAMFRFRATSESSTVANNLEAPAGTPTIRTDGFIDAITIVSGMLFTPASGHSFGTTWEGDVDISSVVDGNGTYTFEFSNAEAAGDDLQIRDVQVGLRVEYTGAVS